VQKSTPKKPPGTLERELFYTDDHEWIDFQGSVAYSGVCSFKLKGIKSIERIDFAENSTVYDAGDIIGSIYYADYKIDIHIPVTGRIHSFNEQILAGNNDLLLQQPENNGWFALIAPLLPCDRKGLLISQYYQMKNRSQWKS